MMKVFLQPGKDKPIRMGHPWVFSGAISRVAGEGGPGSLCSVLSGGGDLLGTGYYNDHSTIRVRMLTSGSEPFDESVLAQRISRAFGLRQGILQEKTDSCRLINSEGDRLPGLVVDKYASGLCIQITTAGMEHYRAAIVDSLRRCCSPLFIYERSDPEARSREGLAAGEGTVEGAVPDDLVITENGLRFHADIRGGQKTGFFFDQRENRALFMRYAAGKNLCDCFCYSGGFTVYGCAAGAASVVAVDSAPAAADLTIKNVRLNGFSSAAVRCETADVFEFLRKTDGRFDCIVLDPPKFAKHKAEVSRAARGYKDINLLAFKKSAGNGVVFTFSCSNAVDPTLFRQIVFAAAADSGRFVQVLHTLCAGPDHPFSIAHREGEYLKGLVLRVM
jgi:23S rRNA (cytosine1962-C5)-methyltransferase